MANTDKSARQSVSLPQRVARRVKALAKTEKTSANRVLVDLIEAGLASKEAERERFFALANRLTESPEPAERENLPSQRADSHRQASLTSALSVYLEPRRVPSVVQSPP